MMTFLRISDKLLYNNNYHQILFSISNYFSVFIFTLTIMNDNPEENS